MNIPAWGGIGIWMVNIFGYYYFVIENDFNNRADKTDIVKMLFRKKLTICPQNILLGVRLYHFGYGCINQYL